MNELSDWLEEIGDIDDLPECATHECEAKAMFSVAWTMERNFYCRPCTQRMVGLGDFMGHGTPRHSYRLITREDIDGLSMPRITIGDATIEMVKDGGVIIRQGESALELNSEECAKLLEFINGEIEDND